MLAWSYGLLNEGEKLLFRCLSIFTGPFSYSVAEAIVGEWLQEQLEEPFLDVLSSLVDKNMVRAVPGDEPLFRLLQTVREYAAEQLTHLPLPALHERHLDYYVQWFAQADQQWRTDQRDQWFKELNHLLADVQAVLSWALDQPRPAGVVEKATQIVNILVIYLRLMGQVSLARQWLTKALQQQTKLPVPLQIALLNQTGWINQLMGQYDHAQKCHQQALVLAEQLEDTNPLISTLTFMGTMAGRMGNYQEADRLLSQCAMYQRQNGQWPSLGITLNNLAITAKYLKEYERAAAILRESIALKEAEGDKMGVAYGLSNLANLAAIQENYPEAVRLHLQSLNIKIELNDPNGQIVALDQIAEVAIFQQNYQIALQFLGTVDTLRRTMATPRTKPVQEEVDRHLTLLREKIPAELYAQIWQAGQKQTLAEAVQTAVDYLRRSAE
jgi:non-specific serine/threonine protein kinase